MGPEAAWTRRTTKSLALCGNQTQLPRSPSPFCSHYTDWDILRDGYRRKQLIPRKTAELCIMHFNYVDFSRYFGNYGWCNRLVMQRAQIKIIYIYIGEMVWAVCIPVLVQLLCCWCIMLIIIIIIIIISSSRELSCCIRGNSGEIPLHCYAECHLIYHLFNDVLYNV